MPRCPYLSRYWRGGLRRRPRYSAASSADLPAAYLRSFERDRRRYASLYVDTMARMWLLRTWLHGTALRVMICHIDFTMRERHSEHAGTSSVRRWVSEISATEYCPSTARVECQRKALQRLCDDLLEAILAALLSCLEVKIQSLWLFTRIGTVFSSCTVCSTMVFHSRSLYVHALSEVARTNTFMFMLHTPSSFDHV